MSVFKEYADVYDALYGDKDYEAECDYAERILAKHSPRPVRSILDVGCGTGGHAIPLARRGYRVRGVDLSARMVGLAREKAKAAGVDVELDVQDARDLRLAGVHDAAVSFFAVMGYQTSDDDLLAALRSVRRHLQPGAPFLFDVWHGPAVLADPPVGREKVVASGAQRIVRRSTATLDLQRQTVLVRFDVERSAPGGAPQRVEEDHLMRFFFPRELHLACRMAGFEVADIHPFLGEGREAGSRDWNVSVVAIAAEEARAP